jgi:ribosomal protein L16 Arg81 hydroxylase
MIKLKEEELEVLSAQMEELRVQINSLTNEQDKFSVSFKQFMNKATNSLN